jgi:hypothetical protein
MHDGGHLAVASAVWSADLSVGGVRGFAGSRLVGRDSGGRIRTRDLRVMRGFDGVSYLPFCRAFVILDEAESG